MRELGVDMASRRLCCCVLTATRTRLGRAIMVNGLVMVGDWSPTFADRLACQQVTTLLQRLGIKVG